MKERHEFVSDMGCAAIARNVRLQEGIFFDRGGFYTLGAAAYLDDPLLYPTLAKLLNPYLINAFKDVLVLLEMHFSKTYNREICYYDGVALPGFHIFDYESRGLIGSIHKDSPEEKIPWPMPYSEPFTFTMPVQLPKEGGGMNWVIDGDIEYVPYEIGTLYVHDGKVPHQIANHVDIQKGDYRITLQGHGVLLGDKNMTLFF